MKKIKTRAVALLIRNDEILLMHRINRGKEYYVFPGGGVESGEDAKSAVVREVEEEASIKCKVCKLLYSHNYPDTDEDQQYYLCKYVSGQPKLGDFNELQSMKEEDQIYEPVWVSIKKLPKLLLYPLEIRDWLIEDFDNNFKNTPRSQTIKTSDLRQEL